MLSFRAQVGVESVHPALPCPLARLHPVHCLVERVGLHPARSPLGLAAADDQAGSFEHLQVARDRGQAHREGLGELVDGGLALGEAGEEVLITRVFEASRERVFRAWTDPDEVAAWYGPEHFDTPRERIHIDLRVGGRYELTMVQRDGGAEFAIGYDIIELVEPELLVLRSDPMPQMGMHEPTVTRVELHDHGAKTRMTLTDGPYAESSHAEAGWNAAFDKLAQRVVAD